MLGLRIVDFGCICGVWFRVQGIVTGKRLVALNSEVGTGVLGFGVLDMGGMGSFLQG